MKRSFPARLLLWLGGHELIVLAAFASLVVGVWIFAEIASEVSNGETQGFDRSVLLAFRNPDLSPLGSDSVQDAARDVTALGGPTVLTLLTLFSGGFLLMSGKKHTAWFVYISVFTGLIASTVLKNQFDRPRPDLVPKGAYVSTASFPSGHSMLAAITYLTLGAVLARSQSRKRLKAFFLLNAIWLTLMVGVSRVYLGVHWPTDVLAGWTAGACWAILCWLVARWLQHRRTIEPIIERGD